MDNLYHVNISLGSNVNNKEYYMCRAIHWLQDILVNSRVCKPYITEPISGKGANYLNSVMEGYFNGDIDTLTRLTKGYELSCGRDEECRKRGEVPIDIDIVTFNGEIIRKRDYSATFFKIGLEQLK
jgi:2-amino-4-hydroxy-6-hydroxymethyldihydropteridine diphosphokinase